jgi:predicted AlkP superfamily phosphohydrolase/phosphomutase
MGAPKLMFFELDGATWTVMKPLLEAGELPNLRRLMDRGAHAVLMSEPPTISPKIWTSIFSGKRPEEHGIDFFGASSKMLRSKRVWDILSGKGYKVGTYGSLVTWPPYPINGFMIPSICALGTETFPAEYSFFQEIALSERKKWKNTTGPILAIWDSLALGAKLLSHGVSPGTFMHGASYVFREKLLRYGMLDKYYRKVFLHLEMGTEFLVHLMKKYQPDFCTWHIHTCDSLAHRYWGYYDPEPFEGRIPPGMIKRFGNVIPDSYRKSDIAIGKLLDTLDEKTNVIVVSDHGGEALPEAINPWTAKHNVILDILGLTGKVVVALFGPGVYLNFKEKDLDLMEKTRKILNETVFEDTGEHVFFTKTFDNVLVVTKPNWKMDMEKITDESTISFGEKGTYKISEICTRQKMQMTGKHADAGIIIMAGPDIQKIGEMPQASIYDMTPTILALLGEPIGKDMSPGQPLTHAFDPGFLEKNPVRHVDTYEDGEYAEADEDIDHDKLAERLKHLGYL